MLLSLIALIAVSSAACPVSEILYRLREVAMTSKGTSIPPIPACACRKPQPHKPFESQGNETTFSANCGVNPEIIVQSTLITLQHRGFVDDQKDFS
jgi:hypothetical protein